LVHQFEEGEEGCLMAAAAAPAPAPAVESHHLLPALSTADLDDFLARLPTLDAGVPDAERIDQIGLLESIKSAAAGAQARVSAAFAASQRDTQADSGVPPRERGRGVAAQIALARKESPARGSRHLGFAEAMVREMPHTMGHLEAGSVSEWRATIVCQETACLSREDRAAVDAALARDLPLLGDRQVEARAKALACQLDAAAMARRAAKAHSERRVSLRPAPDTMTHLTALLPVAQGVAVFAALELAAGSARAAGDDRGRGQVMADTLVERVTGQATAAAVPIEIQLVMPAAVLADQTPRAESDEPSLLAGHVLPAQTARDLVSGSRLEGARLSMRRVLATDDGADLRDVESRRSTPIPRGTLRRPLRAGGDRTTIAAGPPADETNTEPGTRRAFEWRGEVARPGRRFSGALRRFILLRDQACRTPWCDAPIRHVDHAIASRADGPTTATNGQGLCEACNYAKEAAGWRARTVRAGPGHTVRTTTPTGHTYDSTAPPLLPSRVRLRAQPIISALEIRYEALLLSA
jgi:hypothetical protein